MEEIEGHLLDTNHVVPLLRGDERGVAILKRMARIDARSPIFIASAALAELEVGCCLQTTKTRPDAQREIRQTLVTNKIRILEFTRHTAEHYGELKARLALKYGRKQAAKNLKWPEAWSDPIHAQPLSVDEFDLIMISHAVERRFKFLTHDSMDRIRTGLDLPPEMFEDWFISSPE